METDTFQFTVFCYINCQRLYKFIWIPEGNISSNHLDKPQCYGGKKSIDVRMFPHLTECLDGT